MDNANCATTAPAAGAILDRFLHHAEVVPIQGRSHRLKDRAEMNARTQVENES